MKKKIGWNTRPATVKYEWQSRAEIDDSGWQDCPTYPNAILAFPERRYFSKTISTTVDVNTMSFW